jgi:RNA polymerase sigma-70 factor, ECF subfamily
LSSHSQSTQFNGSSGIETPSGTPTDSALVALLRAGDQQTFRELVLSMNSGLVLIAEQYVATRSVAEEVVQETWLAVIKGLDNFEARSSLRTWIMRILTNIAKTRGVREKRIMPFSSIQPNPADDDVPVDLAVDPWRFHSAKHLFSGHWSKPPASFHELPEDRLTAKETIVAIEDAIALLPANLRRVIWLRDVAGWTADEVCEAFCLSNANQRVLLHRARSKVRFALEQQLVPAKDGEA